MKLVFTFLWTVCLLSMLALYCVGGFIQYLLAHVAMLILLMPFADLWTKFSK